MFDASSDWLKQGDTEKVWDQLHNRKFDNSDNYDEKYMKIKFNSDDDLPVKKTKELYDIVMVVRSVFLEDNHYYPEECLYKLAALQTE